jgi:hypothetical protein
MKSSSSDTMNIHQRATEIVREKRLSGNSEQSVSINARTDEVSKVKSAPSLLLKFD